MVGTLDPLIRDLLVWIAREPRTVAEALDAWRTSCPRLSVWEDAFDRGYLQRAWREDVGAIVLLTEAGRDFLRCGSDGVRQAVTSTSHATPAVAN